LWPVSFIATELAQLTPDQREVAKRLSHGVYQVVVDVHVRIGSIEHRNIGGIVSINDERPVLCFDDAVLLLNRFPPLDA